MKVVSHQRVRNVISGRGSELCEIDLHLRSLANPRPDLHDRFRYHHALVRNSVHYADGIQEVDESDEMVSNGIELLGGEGIAADLNTFLGEYVQRTKVVSKGTVEHALENALIHVVVDVVVAVVVGNVAGEEVLGVEAA